MAKKNNFGSIYALLYGVSGTGPIKVKVPVVVTTVPEVPEVIIYRKKYAGVLKSTNPLSYQLVQTEKAEEI